MNNTVLKWLMLSAHARNKDAQGYAENRDAAVAGGSVAALLHGYPRVLISW